MTRTRWLGSCTILLALIVAVPAGAAEESPLAQIPAKAPLVFSLHGVKRTTDRLAALVKNGLPEQAKAVQTFVDEYLNKGLLTGRQLRGLKDDGPLFLVQLNMPGAVKAEEVGTALVVRMTDYKAFRDGLLTADERKTLAEDKNAGWEVATLKAAKVYFIARKDYAVVALDAKAAAEFTRKDRGKGLDTVLSKSQATKLLAADVALYVDPAAVIRTYEKNITAGRQAFEAIIDQAGETGSGKLDKDQVELIKGILGSLVQGLAESTSLVLACEFHPQGLAVHLSAGLDPAGKINDLLKTMKPSALAGLGTLPAGFTTYTAVDFGTDTHKAFRPIIKNWLATSGEKGDTEGRKELQEALDDLLEARPRQVLSVGMPGAGHASLQVWRYRDKARGAEAQFKMFKALKEGATFQFIPLKGKPSVKAKAQPYRGGKLHRATLKWDLDRLADSLLGGDESSGMFRKLAGDGNTFWFGAVEKVNVQVAAKDWKAAEKILNQYFKKDDLVGDSEHKAFAETRSHLPKQATLVSLIHVPPYVQHLAVFVHETIKAQGGKAGKVPVAPEKGADSYLGVAATLQAGEASFDLWIPGVAVGEFRRVLDPLLKKLGEK